MQCGGTRTAQGVCPVPTHSTHCVPPDPGPFTIFGHIGLELSQIAHLMSQPHRIHPPRQPGEGWRAGGQASGMQIDAMLVRWSWGARKGWPGWPGLDVRALQPLQAKAGRP